MWTHKENFTQPTPPITALVNTTISNKITFCTCQKQIYGSFF